MFRIHHTFDMKPWAQDVRQSVALGTGGAELASS